MWLDVKHQIHFHYDSFVCESFVELRVEPRRTERQALHSFYLALGPPARVFRYVDWCGNVCHHFSIPEYHDRIEVVSRSLVETRKGELNIRDVKIRPGAAGGPLLDFLRFGGPVRDSAKLRALEAKVRVGRDAPVGDQVRAIGDLLQERLRYRQEVTTYQSTTDDALEQEAGVCQDFAHVMLGLLRLRGLPGRYASGYLHLGGPSDEPAQSHAWVQVYTPEYGWLSFDPTHNAPPDERYVLIGFGRHYDDVPPNRGIFRGQARETLRAEVRTRVAAPQTVASLHEEIGHIDVPVYRELPVRPQQRAAGLPEETPDQ